MRNLGNTCFAAAAVCALRSCPSAASAIARSGGRVAELFARVASDPGSPAWAALVAESGALIGRRGCEPHDSHELICALAEHLGLEGLFSVFSSTSIRCEGCGRLDRKRERNVYASPDPAGSLAAGLAAACAPRTLASRRCEDGCGATCAAVVRTVPSPPAPPVLVVRAPPRAEGLWVEHSFGFCGSRYFVRAVIVYEGDGSGGHYSCAVASGDGWRLHDDDREARMCPAGLPGASLIPWAHTVLYERA